MSSTESEPQNGNPGRYPPLKTPILTQPYIN